MDIQPCPFCAGEAELNEDDDSVFVFCDSCGAQGPAYTAEEVDEAIDIWNQVSVLALEDG